ncbi:baseplate J/gp47 family protein [Echinicola shivajiensis]|uniref:baseplate J/gp47 family protein n=1 Tax=Echinicola shivajiensis TaxID=1035916 RepID=UPI001BFC692F|nr:baseplate J/gp47 family protein [Echinicola shivajiensis]
MSANCNHIVNILKRDGTGRTELQAPKLSPESVQLHDFDLRDWIIFALNFSKQLNFFPNKLSLEPSGDWRKFFITFISNPGDIDELEKDGVIEKLKIEIAEFLEDQDLTGKLTPHLTLFVAFLKLLEFSKKRFNGITKRHLDYYYHKILQIDKKPIQPDHVYLIFELAKNASQEKLEEGTILDGGKDSSGRKRNYVTVTETVLNKTKVAQIKSIYNEISINKADINSLDSSLSTGNFVMSPMANSYDGQGEDFPKGAEKWWPFGYTKICNANTELPPLPKARLGFSLTSEMFQLAEGTRKVILEFTFANNIVPTAVNSFGLNNALSLELTGEKEWISGTPMELIAESSITANSNKLKLVFELGPEQPAVIPYHPEIHEGKYLVDQPVLRVLFKTEQKEGYNLYRLLNKNTLSNLKIITDVSGISNVQLENDLGVLNPEKPFFPFGPRPGKGSSFIVKYPEAANKPITNFTFQMNYLNTPENLVSHYSQYGERDSGGNISPIITDLDYFSFTSIPTHNNDNDDLFKEEAGVYDSTFTFNLGSNEWKSTFKKELKITLDNSFLHEKYPHFLTVATIHNRRNISIDKIPNEPYTPLAENPSLSYNASDTISFGSLSSENNITLIHESPFGFNQVFTSGQTNAELDLVPEYCHGGEIYIGLEDAKNLQQVTLHFQFLEGSENPSIKDIFTGNQKINWKYLKNNKWEVFQTGEIIQNQTPRFLESGIFQFSLPKAATKDNTILPSGLHWIKATMAKPFDIVCQLIDIKAQAVEAVFENQGNSGDHLAKGLPEKTISKLQERLSWVKSIQQPYPSTDGKVQESDEAYYRRVSERLRHKRRAITLWDYEHLILQEFPKVYKVKCLNHTCSSSFQSPGNVTIILVPDTVQQSVFDIYQPRVSQATLNEVATYVNELNTFHVQAKVINPNYEEVKVGLKVKFKDGLDTSFYLGQIKEDIKRFLSPWAYDQKVTVEFGVTLHRSQLIHYLEELAYVDYLEDLILMKRLADSPPCEPKFEEVSEKDFIRPSNPKSILVSAKEHDINLITVTCKNEPENSQEKCQH